MPSGIFTLKQQELALGQGAWSAAPNYAGTFDGSTQYIVTPSSSNLSMGTGDFTIECWCFPNAQEVRGLFQTSPSAGLPGGQSGIGVYFTTSVGAWNVYLAGTNYTPTGLTLANQWTHIAITRSGTTSRFFVNGVLAQTVAGDTTNYTDTYFVIGGFLSTAYLWRGQISNFRVIKGTALYTAAFTPPQNALTAVSGTQLLTLQNPTIVDNSANNFSLTNTGTVTTSLQYPFSTIKPLAVDYLVVAGGGGGGTSNAGGGGAGGLLQGNLPVATGSAITVTVGGGGSVGANGSNSVFGSISATGGGFGGTGSGAASANGGGNGGSGGGSGQATAGSAGIPGSGVSGQGNAGGSANNSFQFDGGGGGGAGTVGLNQTADNIGGNGGAGIASDISGTRTTYAGGGGGGGDNTGGTGGAGGGGNGGTTGGVDPTAGTANTGGGGGGRRSAGSSGGAGGSGIVIISYPDTYAAPASTTGSPTVSTSGSGSIYLNGSSYWTVPDNASLDMGSSNFTIEGWYYPTGNASSGTAIFSKRADGTVVGGVLVYFFNTSLTPYLLVDTGGSWGINTGSSVSFTANQWNHFAVVRNGSSFVLYVNGVAGVSATSSATIPDNSAAFAVGAMGANGANPSTACYMSNFRVVKGTAVYTAAFTPPAAPLTAITNTSLLFNTVSGAYLADSSTNSLTASVGGAPAWNQLSPFATGFGYKNRVYTWTSSGSITF